jgi:phenylacetate-coenzyme A ligase PaaK-like adenylate-forming protein
MCPFVVVVVEAGQRDSLVVAVAGRPECLQRRKERRTLESTLELQLGRLLQIMMLVDLAEKELRN